MPITVKVAKLGEPTKVFTFDKEVKVSEILAMAEAAAAGYQIRFEGEIVTASTPVAESGSMVLVPKNLRSGR